VTDLAPGRYCLAVCYCGQCSHYEAFRLTGQQWSTLLDYLENPRRRTKWTPSWLRDPNGFVAGKAAK